MTDRLERRREWIIMVSWTLVGFVRAGFNDDDNNSHHDYMIDR